VHDSLVVVIDLIFLLCEVVFLKCDDKLMCRLQWRFQATILGFMDSVDKGKFMVPFSDLFPGLWEDSGCLVDI
jgi:hypothetical protein